VGWLAQRTRTNWGSVPDLHLEGAKLVRAHLEGANLGYAHLESVSLFEAHLEGANLDSAHLEGVNLAGAHLAGASLHGAFLDRVTYLDGIALGDDAHGHAHLADVRWGEVNLAIVDWTRTRRGFLGLRRHIEAIELGDESQAHQSKDPHRKVKDKTTRLRDYLNAVRANRQLATVLRSQGLHDDADRFAYRAQVCQRQVLRRQRRIGAYLFSLFLAALTGYGYRLERIIVVSAVVILGFATAFLVLGQSGLITARPNAGQAIIESLAAFHERAFSGVLDGAHTDPIRGWVTFAEAVVGLVIESTFVAMPVQRLRAGGGS
jgi:hypothetical protein